MTAAIVLAGAALFALAIWILAILSRPAPLNRVSDSWLDHHKYDRRQQRQD